jgi:antitoxin component YwqK of YwqJK toxin-antitoxin module
MTSEIFRYANGEKLQENFYVDGKLVKIEKWYESGQQERGAFYLNNRLNGKYISWYENGMVSEESNYVNGKIHGLFTRWYKNGKQQYEIIFFK